MRCSSSLASLKTTSCLCKTAQTWRGNPANCSDLTQYSGKLFRLGEKIRLHEGARKTIRHHPGFKVTSRKLCLKCAKNLYLRHRFFDEIRQIHRFFEAFRQKLQILLRNQARAGRFAEHMSGAQRAYIEKPNLPAMSTHKNTRQQADDLLVGTFLTH